ncbi:MAG TPA: ABC transporter ATP-binding protein [Thermohalobaculum sp.]|nr:ABC transporter ATP-binding protein [Thermohalobaculum sp.]
MLEVADIQCFYGAVQALRGVSFGVAAGEIHCLLGRNGAGKSTTLKAIMGQVRCRRGAVTLEGQVLSDLPAHRVPAAGVGYVPQGRRLFGDLTVAENLEIGLMARGRGRGTRARVLALFPVLGERLGQRAGSLSGGEQQQLAMARALCLEPRVLLLDEPTEGLQPSMIRLIRDTLSRLRADGVAVLLVEQRVEAVLSIADRVTFVENGRSRETLSARALEAQPELIQRYVGMAAPGDDPAPSRRN